MEDSYRDSPVDDLRAERLRRQVGKIRTETDELQELVSEVLDLETRDYENLADHDETVPDDPRPLEAAITSLQETVESNASDIRSIVDLIDPETDVDAETPDPESDEFTDLVLLALSEAGEMVAEVEYVESLVVPPGPVVADGGIGSGGGGGGGGGGGLLQRITNWLNGIKSKIINKISQTFWDIVNAHKNASSWTIEGEAGFGMLGLSGTVGVGVTFD